MNIIFNYHKTDLCRTIYCDGVIGSITPNGNIQASFFNERVPIPMQTTSEIIDNALVEIPERRAQREGIERNVEVELVLSATAAVQIATWLMKKAQEVDKQVTVIKEESSLPLWPPAKEA